MMRRFLTLLMLVLAPGLSAGDSAPFEHDLGQGLTYVRIRNLPADLPAKPAGKVAALVVDVRYVPASPDAATAFSAWLRFRATPRSPVLVLANHETAADLRQALRQPHQGSGIAVIGIARADFEPDLAVPVSTEEEKAAYDALEKGTPLPRLITDNPDKVRIDEASLARDHPAPPPNGDDQAAGKPETPVVDAVLQRAVHLHRSLIALRRN